MAKNYTQLTPSDTFGGWLQRTNDLSADMSTVVMTVAPVNQPNTTNGAQATGNTHLEGYFSASHISVPNDLKGGTLSSPAPLKIASNVNFNANLVATDSNTIFQTNSNVAIRGSTKKLTVSIKTAEFTGANVTFNGTEFTANNRNIVINANTLISDTAANTNFKSVRYGVEATNFFEKMTTGETDVSGTYTFKGGVLTANTRDVNVNANNMHSTTAANTKFTAGHYRVDAPNMVFDGATLASFSIPVKVTKDFTSNGAVTTFNTRDIVSTANVEHHTTTANTKFTAGHFRVDAPNMVFDGAGTMSHSIKTLFTKDMTINANTAANNITFNSITGTTATITNATVSGNTFVKDIRAIGGSAKFHGTHYTFADNTKAYFGDSWDLRVYHDGVNSYIDEAGVGTLNVRSDDAISFKKLTGNEDMVRMIPDGGIELFHNAVKKFQTQSNGIGVFGGVYADDIRPNNHVYVKDGKWALFGDSNDMQIGHDGTNSVIKDSGTGALHVMGSAVRIQSPAGENMAVFNENGNAQLFHDNVAKIRTESWGATVLGSMVATSLVKGATMESTGAATFKSTISVDANASFKANVNANTGVMTVRDLVVTGNTQLNAIDITGGQLDGDLRWNDGREVRLGTHDDMVLYHSGTHSYIDEKGTGNMYLRSNKAIYISERSNTEPMAKFVPNNGVELFHNGVRKILTTGAGVTVEGSVRTDMITNRTGQQLVLNAGESEGKVANQTGEDVYVNAEGGLTVSTPDAAHANWAAGYAVEQTRITGSSITIKGQTVFHDGYHPNADKLTTARTISLTGDASGSTSFDGSGNVSINVTVGNDSHTHDSRYYTKSEADGRYYTQGTADGRFVNVSGDTMSGNLTISKDDATLYLTETGTGGASNRIIATGGKLYIQNGVEGTNEITFTGYNGADLSKLTRKQTNGTYYEILDESTGVKKSGDTVTGNLQVNGIMRVDGTRGIKDVTGQYGTIQTNGSGIGNYEGYSIDGRVVFMHDGSSTSGLYNDVHNHWQVKSTLNGTTELFFGNSRKFGTIGDGSKTFGNHYIDGNLDMRDNDTIRLGAGDDLRLWHDGTDSYIVNYTGTLYIDGNTGADVVIRTGGGTGKGDAIRCIKDGQVRLYHNGDEKFRVEGGGVNVTGLMIADTVKVRNNEKIIAGFNDDIQIFHDGTHSYIKNTHNGDFIIAAEGGSKEIALKAGTDYALRAWGDGKTTLFYDGANKFETTSSGVHVTGDINGDTVSGSMISGAAEARDGTLNNVIITPLRLHHAFTGAQRDVVGDNGYQILPGGLIIQWVKVSFSNGSGGKLVTLPIAFPNGALGASSSDVGSGVHSTSVKLESKTQIRVWGRDHVGNYGNPTVLHAIVIGY